jgi:glycosyltransferase involved in cell wall biosynthesis
MARSGSRVGYSALIPAFDAAATIAAAIESMLRQTMPPDEIVVVDDGSGDATGEIAKACDPRVTVLRQENRGPGAATNLAIEKTKWPIIASLDADDIWLPGKMEAQLRHLSEHPGTHAVFTHLRTFREDGLRAGVDAVSPGWSRTTMVIRREAAAAIGSFIDLPGSGRGEMIDWLARARHLGLRLDMLDEVHALRRIRPGSLSYGRDAEKDKGYARAAWLALRRRKGTA